MKIRLVNLLLILTLAVAASGCELLEQVFPPTATFEPTWTLPPVPTQPESTLTAAYETRAAMSTLLAITPTPTPSPIPGTPTLTRTPVTPTLTRTPGPTWTASPTGLPCNRMEFIADVTIPDNTLLDPAEVFVKTWRVKNTGSCRWGADYKLVFDNGEKMDGVDWLPLPQNVPPNGTVDLSVELKTPLKPGKHSGEWKLQSAAGTRFGSLTVIIRSGSADTNFRVNYLDISVDPPTYTGACPKTFNFKANIVTTNAGEVRYYWERSDGQKSPTQTLTYTKADLKTVSYSWTLSKNGLYWVKIFIESPNNQGFEPRDFTLTCNP